MSPQNLTLVNSIIEKDTSGGFVPERTLLLLLQPQPEQQPTPSFAGINKSDGSPGGTGGKRPRKGSDSKLDRARVRLIRINVEKEKEKLRKRIKLGTSTVS
jgi:hypothetical protein